MHRPNLLIVSPAPPAARNGNAHTAARWARLLAPVADVSVALQWTGEPVDALIALHARRSAESVARFRQAHPTRPLAVVLTGTDLYQDLEHGDASAQRSLHCASHLVVLQPEALERLAPALRARTRVILQSAEAVPGGEKTVDFVAVGHLRAVKDPLTLMRAAALLPETLPLAIVHVGEALEPALADAARRTMAACPRYRWLGGLPADETRRRIAGARFLVHMSRMEGGANVVIEAIRCGVPVLASRVEGNVGLLGRDYPGYFPVGDAQALAALMRTCLEDEAFGAGLEAACAARAGDFAPEAEARALQALVVDMVRGEGPPVLAR